MRDRARLGDLQTILEVQRVRRSEAEVAMLSARQAGEAARAAEAEARQRFHDADRDWREHVGGGAYDPLRGRWFAERAVARCSEHAQATVRADLAGEAVQRRQAEWQLREAQVRSNEERAAEIKSRIARSAEEKRSLAAGDRVTYDWVSS